MPTPHTVIALLVAVACFSSVLTAEGGAILQSAVFGGSTYYLVGSTAEGAGIRWTDAEDYAVSSGGHLATIDSSEEHDFLFDTFGAAQFGSYLPAGALWIGLNDQSVEGTFVWSSGAPVTYTNWALGEPTNTFNREDWAVISVQDSEFPFTNGRWNDIPNIASGIEVNAPSDRPVYGIVEVVPEPGSLSLAAIAIAFVAIAIRTSSKRQRLLSRALQPQVGGFARK